MKKIGFKKSNQLILGFLLILILSVSVFVGCSKKDENKLINNGIQNSTITNETTIHENSLNLENYYYDHLVSTYNYINEDNFDSSEFMAKLFQNNLAINTLNNNERILFENYFNENNIINYNNLTNFKNSLIENNNLVETNNIMKVIDFTKAVIRFHEFLELENRTDGGDIMECVDMCMNSRLRDIFWYGNELDKIYYIAGLPYSFYQMLSSCTLDCKRAQKERRQLNF